MPSASDPEQYVIDNEEQLCRIIKHSSNTFVRSLALAAIVEFGPDPSIDEVIDELKQLDDTRDKQ